MKEGFGMYTVIIFNCDGCGSKENKEYKTLKEAMKKFDSVKNARIIENIDAVDAHIIADK